MNKRKLLFLFLVILILNPKNVLSVGTAKFSLSSSKTTFSVNETFPVTIRINTGGETIISAKAKLSYPTDLLEITSMAKDGSFVNLWTHEEAAAGLVNYTGGVNLPGATGNSLTFLTINFRAKAAGSANLSFLSRSEVYSIADANILDLAQSTGMSLSLTRNNKQPDNITPDNNTNTVIGFISRKNNQSAFPFSMVKKNNLRLFFLFILSISVLFLIFYLVKKLRT